MTWFLMVASAACRRLQLRVCRRSMHRPRGGVATCCHQECISAQHMESLVGFAHGSRRMRQFCPDTGGGTCGHAGCRYAELCLQRRHHGQCCQRQGRVQRPQRHRQIGWRRGALGGCAGQTRDGSSGRCTCGTCCRSPRRQNQQGTAPASQHAGARRWPRQGLGQCQHQGVPLPG